MHRVQVDTSPSPALLGLLKEHIPYSLPLLRRLQFTKFPGGRTQDTRILLACASPSSARADDGASGIDPSVPFAAAYVDFSRGPETEVWMYSSLEQVRPCDGADGHGEQPAQAAEIDLAIAVLREIKAQRDAYVARGGVRERDTVLLGTFSEKLRLALVATTSACTSAPALSASTSSSTIFHGSNGGVDEIAAPIVFPNVEIYDKWLMRLETLPDVPDPTVTPSNGRDENEESGETLHWTQVQKSDIPMVLSRTSIPRKERTILLLPSMALATSDGTLVAWAFLGPDSSLTSLHCEPDYRGRGLAKAVAVKIFKEHLGRFGSDGFCFADVAPENRASQGVCKSLGARTAWQMSWAWIDLDKSFPDMLQTLVDPTR